MKTDFRKIDVQGHVPSKLKGATQLGVIATRAQRYHTMVRGRRVGWVRHLATHISKQVLPQAPSPTMTSFRRISAMICMVV